MSRLHDGATALCGGDRTSDGRTAFRIGMPRALRGARPWIAALLLCLGSATTLYAQPTITTQPTEQTECAGGTATFTVVAAGATGYQWRYNGVDISGATSDTLTLTSLMLSDAGAYRVLVSDGTGSTLSDPGALSVLSAPTIVTQPTSETACEGTDVTFNVTASGAGLSYTWTRDGSTVGGNSPALALIGVSSSDAGSYQVIVTGSCGITTSAVVTLDVLASTVVVAQPTNQSACEGGAVTFATVGTGSGALSYAWTKDGVSVGTDSPTLSVTGIGAADVGNYQAVITGTCGSVTTNVATLTLLDPPTITSDPMSQSACPGDNVTFTVAATGAGLSYAWTQDGASVGTDSPTLSLSGVDAGSAGNYAVTVTGTCGTATSMSATLTVGTSTVITMDPTSQSSCAGDSVTFSVAAAGDALTYAWNRDGTPVGTDSPSLMLSGIGAGDAGNYSVTVTGTCGAATSASASLTLGTPTLIDTPPASVAACPGDLVTFTVAASGDSLSYAWTRDGSPVGSDSPTLTLASALPADAGAYVVTVTGTCGTESSAAANLTLGTPTSIDTAPTAQVGCPGDAVSFTVVASGDSLSYAWTRDGVPVGIDSPTLTIASTTPTDAGSYAVTVSGDCGVVSTAGVDLTLGVTTAIDVSPVAQTACPGDMVTFSVTASGDLLSYAWTRDGSPVGSDSPTLTLASVLPADAGSYVVTVTGACGTVSSTGAGLTVGIATTIDSAPTAQSGCPGDTVTFSVAASGDGLSYAWTRDGMPVGIDSPSLVLGSVGAGDLGSYAVTVSGDCGAVTSSGAALTLVAPTAITTGPAAQTGCTGASVTFSVAATGDNLSYAWTRDGSAVGADSATLILSGLTAVDAGNYAVTITGTCGSVTSAGAALTILESPVVTMGPSSLSACPGDTVTFMSAATGSDLTYQWTRDGNPVGVDSPNLELVGVTPADVGVYRVTVSNSCGDVMSSPAALSVFDATEITTQPLSSDICEGDAVTLTVAATGAGTLSYSWTRNGAPVGTDAPELVIASASPSDDGSYQVQVTGDCGATVSDVATLNVAVPPTILAGPVDQTVVEGNPILLSVTAFGSDLSYQWSFGGAPIMGATTATLSIASAALSDAGSYSVVIQNNCGMFTESANVIVQPLVPPPVENIQCCFNDLSAQVCWDSGIVYDSIEVVRNGVVVATLPGDEVCYLDPILPFGTYVYEITGIIGAMIGDTVTCTTTPVSGPTNLTCEVFDETPFAYSAALNWENTELYDQIQIDRDGGLVAVLAGDAITFTETGLVLGQHDYVVRGVFNSGGEGCPSTAEITCTVPNGGTEIFRRGDSNNDGVIDVSDVIFIISWLFTDGPDPSCFDAADANDDGIPNIADAVFLISYNFLDGIDPPPPFPAPGVDPTTDMIGCEDSIEMP